MSVQSELIQMLLPGEPLVCDLDTQFGAIQQSLTKLKTHLSDIQQQLRTLEKTVKTVKKEKEKEKETVKECGKTLRQPKIIGFDIQEPVTPELCAFMRLPPNSTTTRNAATHYITEYIRTNKLQDMTNRRCINLNAELAALFNATEMTYFNLHKHISAHIIRT